jgi:hypothetical protein
MSSQPIFLIQPDGERIVLDPRPYKKELVLQELLTQHPAVLAGGTTDGDGTGGLLLVHPEIGIPKAEGGGDTFNMDHLFVDRSGVPVFVEVKRSSDTRIRREVVGQMLDYAANGSRYWPISKLREALNDIQAKEHPDDASNRFFGDDAVLELIDGGDIEEFWQTVEQNLRQGKVRLVFVADQLPDELVRIIEFLNEQMKPAEVLGVEVAQYVGPNDMKVLVPRLVGATSAAAEAKGTARSDDWNTETFFDVAATREHPKVVELFRRLFAQIESHAGTFSWGNGATPGLSGYLSLGDKIRPVWLGQLSAPGQSSHPSLMFYFKDLSTGLEDERFEAVLSTLSKIEFYKSAVEGARGVQFEGKGSFPRLLLDTLVKSDADVEALFEALDIAAGLGIK